MLVTELVNELVCLMWLQHRLLLLLHGWENPIVFILGLFRVTLLSEIWLPPMISLRFFVLRYAKKGQVLKQSF